MKYRITTNANTATLAEQSLKTKTGSRKHSNVTNNQQNTLSQNITQTTGVNARLQEMSECDTARDMQNMNAML